MLHWYTDVIKQYAVFDGRASRPEYWWFFLINTVISVILDIVIPGTTGQVLGAIYALAVLLPSIGVGIRRLHDTNRTGWWLLVSLVPLVYVSRPPFWGIQVVGSNPAAPQATPAVTNVAYDVELDLDGLVGSAGVEVVGATRTERIAVTTS